MEIRLITEMNFASKMQVWEYTITNAWFCIFMKEEKKSRRAHL